MMLDVRSSTWYVILCFMPLVILYELPYMLLIMAGVCRHIYKRRLEGERRPYYPPVSCIVTCYSEGASIRGTIMSVTEQIYPGQIQIIAMIDGADANRDTYDAAMALRDYVRSRPKRRLEVVPKWKRGGRVSNINTGLLYVDGDIVFILDGDTSFDNDMVERATRHFEDPSVAALAGSLCVRNADASLTASLQAIEYLVAIQTFRAGLSDLGILNNISGAFGVFRKSAIDLVRGWDAGTAEDLDMTMRLKQYTRRAGGKFRLIFDPEAIGYTDVPDTLTGYFKQRLRWDGDLPYIYIKKHWKAFRASLIGWPNLLSMLLNGIFAQIIFPGVIFVYTLLLFFLYPAVYAWSLMAFLYIFYLMLLIPIYLFSVIFISRRKRSDMSRFPLLFIYPLFSFAARINGMIAILCEIFMGTHEDSSMAPWWVSKKNKFN